MPQPEGKNWYKEVGNISDEQQKVCQEFYEKRAILKGAIEEEISERSTADLKDSTFMEQYIASKKFLFGCLKDGVGDEKKAYELLYLLSRDKDFLGNDININVDKFWVGDSVAMKKETIEGKETLVCVINQKGVEQRVVIWQEEISVAKQEEKQSAIVDHSNLVENPEKALALENLRSLVANPNLGVGDQVKLVGLTLRFHENNGKIYLKGDDGLMIGPNISNNPDTKGFRVFRMSDNIYGLFSTPEELQSLLNPKVKKSQSRRAPDLNSEPALAAPEPEEEKQEVSMERKKLNELGKLFPNEATLTVGDKLSIHGFKFDVKAGGFLENVKHGILIGFDNKRLKFVLVKPVNRSEFTNLSELKILLNSQEKIEEKNVYLAKMGELLGENLELVRNVILGYIEFTLKEFSNGRPYLGNSDNSIMIILNVNKDTGEINKKNPVYLQKGNEPSQSFPNIQSLKKALKTPDVVKQQNAEKEIPLSSLKSVFEKHESKDLYSDYLIDNWNGDREISGSQARTVISYYKGLFQKLDEKLFDALQLKQINIILNKRIKYFDGHDWMEIDGILNSINIPGSLYSTDTDAILSVRGFKAKNSTEMLSFLGSMNFIGGSDSLLNGSFSWNVNSLHGEEAFDMRAKHSFGIDSDIELTNDKYDLIKKSIDSGVLNIDDLLNIHLINRQGDFWQIKWEKEKVEDWSTKKVTKNGEQIVYKLEDSVSKKEFIINLKKLSNDEYEVKFSGHIAYRERERSNKLEIPTTFTGNIKQVVKHLAGIGKIGN